MENKLVTICIKILRLLPSDGLHFNAIFRQTGISYKPDVVKAVSMLGKSRLVMEMPSPAHKQKKIQRLTDLGIELVNFISDIEQIHRSHSEMKRLLVEKFGIDEVLNETGIKNMLTNRGWNPAEKPFYHEFTRYALLLTTESLNMIYNVLIYRYSELSLKYDIKNVARLILNKVILDALEYHISNARDTQTMRQLYYTEDNNEGTRIIMDRLLSSIDAIEEHNPYLNRFTDKEGASLLTSICSMLDVPKMFLNTISLMLILP